MFLRDRGCAVYAHLVAILYWDFHVFATPHHIGNRGRLLSTLRARRVGIGARSFAGDTESCCVGRAWQGRKAAGGPVAIGSNRSLAAHTVAGIVGKIPLDITTTAQHYKIMTKFTRHVISPSNLPGKTPSGRIAGYRKSDKTNGVFGERESHAPLQRFPSISVSPQPVKTNVKAVRTAVSSSIISQKY